MLAYVFVLVAIAVRFLPHPLAFTPVAAALLYFGARGSRRQLWLPFVLLAASDVALTRIVYSYPFSWDHFVTWAWYPVAGYRVAAECERASDRRSGPGEFRFLLCG
jgi:hypothetical protein